MASLDSLKVPELKKILRGCDVDPTDILAAKTRMELLELARFNGITEVPDEWTIAKIKQQRQAERQKAQADADAPSLAPAASTSVTGRVAAKAANAMSFFSKRDRVQASSGAEPPEGTTSVASNAARQRLERSKARSERSGAGATGGGPKARARGPLRGPMMRTLGELKAIGFGSEQAAKVQQLRAALAEPPTGEAADPGLVSLSELKALEFAPVHLAQLGQKAFAPALLQQVGYGAKELAADKRITAAMLRDMGFGPAELRTELGLSYEQLRLAGCVRRHTRPAHFARRPLATGIVVSPAIMKNTLTRLASCPPSCPPSCHPSPHPSAPPPPSLSPGTCPRGYVARSRR
jgi:hypothetical protein